MPATPPASGRFHRVGNHLATDFVNTVYDPEHPEGSLRSAKDVVAFLAETEALDAAGAAELRRRVAGDEPSRRFLDRALALRAALTAALAAFEAAKPIPQRALATLNDVLRAGAGYEQLVPHRRRGYEVAYRQTRADLASALVPVARAAAHLLADREAPVRKCAGEGCVRYFYDDSRTRRRRWCDMAVCGNRAKASAFLERRRAQLP
jgi:predicted RNA-binding Zn ribbon-like protein